MRGFFVLTVVLLTAACSDVVPPPPAPPPPPPVETTPLPTPRPDTGAGTRSAPTPVARPARPQVEPFRLEVLGGATESAVTAMIGKPDEIRDQPPGKVLVYNQGACRVEVYMYPSVDVGSMAALGAAIMPADLPDDDRARCRRSLARRTGVVG